MKKRKKQKYRLTCPNNYSFWVYTLSEPKHVKAFIDRGSDKQKDNITHVLIYMEKFDPEKFEAIKGKEILKELQK